MLKINLGWHKSRIDCFTKMLLALMNSKSVNLARLTTSIPSRTSISTRYRRLQRFFSGCKIDYNKVAKFIFNFYQLDGKEIYLTMDRTNWKWGKKNINILCLGIVYKGAAIPVYWLLLNKQGNSSTRERIALINRFIEIFGSSNILGIFGDREFIGKNWFNWLSKKKIPFYFRIKKDANTFNSNGKGIDVSWLFFHLKPGEKKVIPELKNIVTIQRF